MEDTNEGSRGEENQVGCVVNRGWHLLSFRNSSPEHLSSSLLCAERVSQTMAAHGTTVLDNSGMCTHSITYQLKDVEQSVTSVILGSLTCKMEIVITTHFTDG